MTFQKIILNSAQADPFHDPLPLPTLNFGKEERPQDKRPCGCGGSHEEPTTNVAAAHEEPILNADPNHEPLPLPPKVLT